MIKSMDKFQERFTPVHDDPEGLLQVI